MTPAQLDLLRTLIVRGCRTDSERGSALNTFCALCEVLSKYDAVLLPEVISS
jgi:hypothetical protein